MGANQSITQMQLIFSTRPNYLLIFIEVPLFLKELLYLKEFFLQCFLPISALMLNLFTQAISCADRRRDGRTDIWKYSILG